ncbi:MAG: DUF3040 domain-containing protein [Actinomycetota bacterium]
MGGGLSDHEQRVLEEIERQLELEDPRLAEAVSRTSLHAHLARRVRLATLSFVAGFIMLMLFAVSVWVAIIGFAAMLASALFAYHQLRRISGSHARGRPDRASLSRLLARLAERFRGNPQARG